MPGASYSTPLLALDAVVLDTETTGLDARTARIVQIGALRLAGGSLRRRSASTAWSIPAADPGGGDRHARHHAMTWWPQRRLSPTWRRSSRRSRPRDRDRPHHPLRPGRAAAGVRRSPAAHGRGFAPSTCAMLAQLAAPTLADHSLDRLCEWLGIEIKGRHTALGDAEAAGHMFIALVPLLRARNIRTLAEAEAASRALAERRAQRTADMLPASTAPAEGDARARARRQLPLPPPRARRHERAGPVRAHRRRRCATRCGC